jgi:DegV family protein with EDD domain
MGLGNITISAARLAAAGKSIDDVAGAAEDLVHRTRVLGTLDTLENLKKGGRIGGAKAMLGSMLSLKPVIWVNDGVVEEESKQRTRSRALRYLADKVAEQATQGIENLAVMHGDAPDLDEFLDLLDAHFPREDIVIGDIGAVIGTHAGPRVMGLAYNTTG